MKITRQRLFGALALLGALWVTSLSPGHAAPPTAPAEGDVFLGVRATGGTGASESLLINVGSLASFEGVAPGGTLSPSLGDVGTALQDKYGAGWETRADLRWALFGKNNSVNPVVFVSRPQNSFGTPAAAFPALGLQARSQVATQTGSLPALVPFR